MGSGLSGMKILGSNRVDSDSNTLKCKFLDSNWHEQSVNRQICLESHFYLRLAPHKEAISAWVTGERSWD